MVEVMGEPKGVAQSQGSQGAGPIQPYWEGVKLGD